MACPRRLMHCLNFWGNLVRSNYPFSLLKHSKITPYSPHKLTSERNAFLGKITNFFVQGAPSMDGPAAANDQRCNYYSNDALYEYAVPSSDYIIQSSPNCTSGRWTQVLNTVGTINSFGANTNNCTRPSGTYRCVLNDNTSSYDSSLSLIGDLNSSMSTATSPEPHSANFGSLLSNSVGDYLKGQTFFNPGVFAEPKRRVNRDFKGRWRGLITNPGATDARFLSFWPRMSSKARR